MKETFNLFQVQLTEKAIFIFILKQNKVWKQKLKVSWGMELIEVIK